MSKGKQRKEARRKRVESAARMLRDWDEAIATNAREAAQVARRRRLVRGGLQWPRKAMKQYAGGMA